MQLTNTAPNQMEMIDFSAQASIGIKGAHAASWLSAQQISVPQKPNHWVLHNETHLVLRLGMQELLIQQIAGKDNSHPDDCLATLESSLARNLHDTNHEKEGVYHVPRADSLMQLTGHGVLDLLAQTCRLNISNELQDHALVMTQVAGINAILLKVQAVTYLWFDQSYHAYMVETITELTKQSLTIKPFS